MNNTGNMLLMGICIFLWLQKGYHPLLVVGMVYAFLFTLYPVNIGEQKELLELEIEKEKLEIRLLKKKVSEG